MKSFHINIQLLKLVVCFFPRFESSLEIVLYLKLNLNFSFQTIFLVYSEFFWFEIALNSKKKQNKKQTVLILFIVFLSYFLKNRFKIDFENIRRASVVKSVS